MSITASELSKSFGDKRVLDHLSFTLPDRGVVAIEGPSGAGKTTLLNILMGLETPDSGRLSGLENKRFTAVFQENRLLEAWTVRRNIALVCPRGVSDADICAHLSELGLANELRAPVKSLSGGMKRRVALVRAIIAPGDILALDEPFKGLDDAAREEAARYVLRRAGDRLILLVSHDGEDKTLLGATQTIQIGGQTP